MTGIQKIDFAIKTIHDLPLDKSVKKCIKDLLTEERKKFKIEINDDKPAFDRKTMGCIKQAFSNFINDYIDKYSNIKKPPRNLYNNWCSKYFQQEIGTNDYSIIEDYISKGLLEDSWVYDAKKYGQNSNPNYLFDPLKPRWANRISGILRLGSILEHIQKRLDNEYDNTISNYKSKIPDPENWMINAYAEIIGHYKNYDPIKLQIRETIKIEYFKLINKTISNDAKSTIQ